MSRTDILRQTKVASLGQLVRDTLLKFAVDLHFQLNINYDRG